MHLRSRKPLQDTLTAIRLKTPLADCGFALAPNAEQHLRPRAAAGAAVPRRVAGSSVRIAQRCRFELDELRYDYPAELVPPGSTPIAHLRALTEKRRGRALPRWRARQGARADREGAGADRGAALRGLLPHRRTTSCASRAARASCARAAARRPTRRSATAWASPRSTRTQTTLLFERFISRERDEPPDIDVDFEHERREEVIQYIYTKYGHHRTALAAALATYRTRGAVRDVGKALGLDALADRRVRALVPVVRRRRRRTQRGLHEAGLDAEAAPVTQRWVELVGQLRGFPRHLSQHVGGFVIADDKLARLVPIENAAMDNRRVIQWDKDDLESLGLLKVDVLALGMLTRACAARWP